VRLDPAIIADLPHLDTSGLWRAVGLRYGEPVLVPICHSVSPEGVAVGVRWTPHLPAYVLVAVRHDRAERARHPFVAGATLDTYDHPHWAVVKKSEESRP
jgi:hypothetical protein